MIFKTLAALTGFTLLAATSASAAAPTVRVTNAWCRAAPTGALAGGCYVTLTAAANDRLVAVETAAADHGEIHTMDMTAGVMRMRQLKDGIVLPAGQPVELKPGARHLMIIGPKQPLTLGGLVPLTLRFEKSPPISLKAPIRAPGARAGGQ
jgi:copper(I)-binding protein